MGDRNVFEIAKQKLEAETSIGVLAMLISGFAISIIPSITVSSDTCNCMLWDEIELVQYVLFWLHTMIIVYVCGMSGISVLYTTGLYWKGMKLLSTREQNKWYRTLFY